MKKTELAIVGLGGVGGYFGFKLARKYAAAPAVRITFVARGETYRAVQQNGLTLLSPEHPEAVAHPHALIRDVGAWQNDDMILVCVKAYDLEDVCGQLRKSVRGDVMILPLMNGVDIHEKMGQYLPDAIILPACVYVASHLKEKGVVEHKGNPGKIIVGKDPRHPDYHPGPVVGLLTDAGIDANYQEDAFPAIWTKYCFIASFGLVTARYNKSIGQVCQEPLLRERAGRIMAEIKAVAGYKGITLPEDILEQTFRKAASFPYHTPTSLQLDVQAGKANTELELFAGPVLAYGQVPGASVEETRNIYREIKELTVR